MSPLRRVTSDEISARSPLPFTVFDQDGKELFTAGVVIGSIGYTQLLIGRGLYRMVREPSPTYGVSPDSATRKP